jgi:hypothetical protein
MGRTSPLLGISRPHTFLEIGHLRERQARGLKLWTPRPRLWPFPSLGPEGDRPVTVAVSDQQSRRPEGCAHSLQTAPEQDRLFATSPSRCARRGACGGARVMDHRGELRILGMLTERDRSLPAGGDIHRPLFEFLLNRFARDTILEAAGPRLRTRAYSLPKAVAAASTSSDVIGHCPPPALAGASGCGAGARTGARTRRRAP